MIRVFSTIKINASADAIWQLINDFGAVCPYRVGFVHCTVEGEGIGALRTLINSDGGMIIERLEAQDPNAQRLSYGLLTDTPFRNCVTTMALRVLGQNQAELEWSATFEADGLPASEAEELMGSMLEENCVALKRVMESNRKEPSRSPLPYQSER